MRVLHVTSSFPRDETDPNGTFIAGLVIAEAEAGAEVMVVAPHDAGVPVAGVYGPVLVRRFRYAPPRWEMLSYRGGLLAAARRPLVALLVPAYVTAMAWTAALSVRRHRAEVVHAHWWFPGGVAALIAARLAGVPYVVTLHGSDVPLARRFGLRTLARAVIGRAAAVLAVSQALATEAESAWRLPAGSVHVLVMPISFAPPAPPPPPPPPLRLVGVGRLAPEKGFDVLVRACVGLVDAGADVEVDIIGAGPEWPALSRLGAPLGERLRFRGPLAPGEMQGLIADAHAVVVPSRREGLGLVAVEAMAMGRPVVATAVGGLPETVVDGVDGVLVGPDDVSALTDALRRLPLPPPRGAAVGRHRPEVVSAAHLDLYSSALDARVARWRPLRWLGAAVGLAVLAVLVRIVVRDWPAIRHAWRHPQPAALVIAVFATMAAEVGFGLASAVALRGLTGPVPGPWSIARTFWLGQTAKNVPGGVWTALARAGLVAPWGVGPRETLAWLATEAAASCTAGTVVGAAACAGAAASGPAGLPVAAWVVLALAGASAPLALHGRFAIGRGLARVTRVAVEPATVGRAAAAYVPVWLASAVATAALSRALVPLDARAMVVAGGAACVASVTGFVAVPVPSGLGVRELVLVALLSVVMPAAVATSIALASRVLAVVVQTALAGVSLPSIRRLRA